MKYSRHHRERPRTSEMNGPYRPPPRPPPTVPLHVLEHVVLCFQENADRVRSSASLMVLSINSGTI